MQTNGTNKIGAAATSTTIISEHQFKGQQQQQTNTTDHPHPHLSHPNRPPAAAAAKENTKTDTIKKASDTRQRPQQSAAYLLIQDCRKSPTVATEPQNDTQQQQTNGSNNNNNNQHKRPQQSSINYWHYKQTGIKSRPIKLLKHPIEHIERNIVITYLLGFLFKLIAIFSGPVVVLVVYLITVPFVALRRLTWFLLNLSCLFDARIRTITDDSDNDDDSQVYNNIDADQPAQGGAGKTAPTKESLSDKQVHWSYCPLSFIETYWFKEKVVNTVILVVDNSHGHFDELAYVDKLRNLVGQNILCKPSFRKFLSRVVARGLPFYKGLYWRYLGTEDGTLAAENCNSFQQQTNTSKKPEKDESSPTVSDRGRSDSDSVKSMSTSSEQFSVTSIRSSITQPPDHLHILIPATDNKQVVDLEQHIFLDRSLKDSPQQTTCSAVRRYAHHLLATGLNMDRPLWELRVVPTAILGRMYLIFRCHQSLADGRSLSKILTDHLTTTGNCRSESNTTSTSKANTMADLEPVSLSDNGDENNDDDDDDDDSPLSEKIKKLSENIDDDSENELKPIKEKSSFVSKVSKSTSLRSAIFVGPLTVLLWVIWTFTRRKHNHLNKCLESTDAEQLPVDSNNTKGDVTAAKAAELNERRFYMTHYDLTRFHQIKQMTRSTVSDVILCALSGALRDYLRKFNGVSNPPNLNISLTVDMRQPEDTKHTHHYNDHDIGDPMRAQSKDLPVMINSHKNSTSGGHGGDAATNKRSTNNKGLSHEKPQVKCTLVNVPLPTSVEGTVPRLWELRNTMDELRASADPWVMLGLQRFLFTVLPASWYRWVINYVALRNSSTFVSNIRGPQNMVEAWCVDLLQKAIEEARQPPREYTPLQAANYQEGQEEKNETNETGRRMIRYKLKRLKEMSRLKLGVRGELGSILAIYYCMQPPTSNIPISFNCITYHDKLFVASLSRSLLVEDSKQLIRLFFRQLDQLANTIAKRRSLVTMIQRAPISVEINCQPASPTLDDRAKVGGDTLYRDNRSDDSHEEEDDNHGGGGDDDDDDHDDNTDQDDERTNQSVAVKPSPYLFDRLPKDDMEAGIVSDEVVADRCRACQQTVCICRRRKSLFSFDNNKQRAVNLFSLLHPAHFGKSAQHSMDTDREDTTSPSRQSQSECLCGQQLLEELDEETNDGNNNDDDANLKIDDSSERDTSNTGSRTPIDFSGRSRRLLCNKCRLSNEFGLERSTLSLDTPAGSIRHQQQLSQNNNWLQGGVGLAHSSHRNNQAQSSCQLIVPVKTSTKFKPKSHSKSETDLLPVAQVRGLDGSSSPARSSGFNQKGLTKESWFVIGKKSYRKLSMFHGKPANSQIDSSKIINRSKSRNLMELPVDMMQKRASKKRRQSVATTTGTQHLQRSIVVKDEINADVSLRYQLDSPFLGIRNRRFSTIGGVVVGNQRKASLIPFGLMHNQSLPKLFWDDGETHL